MILDRLDAAVEPADLDLPGLGFHALKGSRKEEFAVRRRYMNHAPLAFSIYCLRYMKRMRALQAEAAH